MSAHSISSLNLLSDLMTISNLMILTHNNIMHQCLPEVTMIILPITSRIYIIQGVINKGLITLIHIITIHTTTVNLLDLITDHIILRVFMIMINHGFTGRTVIKTYFIRTGTIIKTRDFIVKTKIIFSIILKITGMMMVTTAMIVIVRNP